MKIKELHKDIERYLKEDCYCPNEVYSFDGFFYNLFYADQECEYIGKSETTPEQEEYTFYACIAHPSNDKKSRPQIVIFSTEDNEKIFDAIRMDATENNLKIVKSILKVGQAESHKKGYRFDEYEEGSTAKSLKEIMSISDAIMVD